VLVLGAGVAGLQAIATARRLGATFVPMTFRSAAKSDVKSLGAAFVELDLETQEGEGGYAREQSEDFLRRQRELIGKGGRRGRRRHHDCSHPGRKAPVLVTEDDARKWRSGA